MHIILPLHNIRIIDFSAIFAKHVETNLINDLDSFNLIKDNIINIKNKEVKRLLYHHTIIGLCEYILEVKSKQKVIIHHSTLLSNTKELKTYIEHNELQDFLNSLIKKIQSMLPIKFLITDESFKILKREFKSGNGTKMDLISQAKYIVDKFDISKFNFNKARYFAKRYKLNYLSNNYFKKINSKQLILS